MHRLYKPLDDSKKTCYNCVNNSDCRFLELCRRSPRLDVNTDADYWEQKSKEDVLGKLADLNR